MGLTCSPPATLVSKEEKKKIKMLESQTSLKSGPSPFPLALNLGQVRAIGARSYPWTEIYGLSLSLKPSLKLKPKP